MSYGPPWAEPPLPETDAARLLRERLATDARRAPAAEPSRVRRRQLELDVPADASELGAASDLDADLDEGDE